MLCSLLLRKKRLNLLWIPKMRDTIKMFDFQYSCLKSLVLPKTIAFTQEGSLLTTSYVEGDGRPRINSTDSMVSSASTTASERSYDGQIEWQPWSKLELYSSNCWT